MHDDAEGPSRNVAAAIAVLAAIAVIGAVTLLTGSGNETAPRAARAAYDGDCPTSRPQMHRLNEPPTARWQLVGTMQAPESADAGPARVDRRGFRLCFAHTTEGALFAAINFWATFTTEHLSGRPALQVYLAHNAQRGREIAETPVGKRIDTLGRISVIAYRIEQLRRDSVVATLALGLEGSGRSMQMQSPMVWEDGDWRLAAPSVGTLVISTDGPDETYTAWGAPGA